MKKWIYIKNIVGILKELADRDYQKRIWLNTGDGPGMTISFVEAVNMLFDDCVVGDYLREGEILFDRATTAAFHELDRAVDAVSEYDENGEFRREEDIIDDPLMNVLRNKAAKVLALIEVSDGKESTVEIMEDTSKNPL